jgi:hypothetical protein
MNSTGMKLMEFIDQVAVLAANACQVNEWKSFYKN